MSFTTSFKTICLTCLIITDHWYATYGAPAPTDVDSTATPNLVPNLPTPLLPQPLPGLTDSILFRPLVQLNNQLAAAAQVLPEQLGQQGKAVGSVLSLPVVAWNNTANSLVDRLNQTVLVASNAVHPIMLQPLLWFNQLNNMATGAIGRTNQRIGEHLTLVGQSINGTGRDVAHLGATIGGWAANVTTLAEQLRANLTAAAGLGVPIIPMIPLGN